jgi:uncharacterized membrane protein
VSQSSVDLSLTDAGIQAELPSSRIGSLLARIRAVAGVPAIALLTGAWALVFSAASVLRHASFHTHRFDLGNMTQAVWSTAHGRFLEATSAGGDQFVRLGAHADPLLAAFALPWLLWPSPLVLLVVQSVAISFGALPVYLLARKHTRSPRVALRFALAYLLYPATQWNTLGGFHPVSLAIPLLLFAIWYLDEARWLPFLAFATLAALTKEQVPLLIAGLGLWHAYRRRERLVGLAIAGIGIAWFAVNVFVILPHFAPADGSVISHRYASIGGSAGGIVETLASDPWRVLDKVLTLGALVFVLRLLAPLAGLSLLEPGLAACALPGLMICLLADKADARSITAHYTANVAPFLIAAAVLGAARLGPERARRLSAAALTATALFAVASPLLSVPTYIADLFSGANAARAAAVRLVPSGAPVASTNDLGGHLSARRRVFSVPTIDEARWIVVDTNDPTLEDKLDKAGFARFLRSLEHNPQWERIYACDGILAFHRASAATAQPHPACPGS